MLIVMIGWVFFRSPSLNYATNYLSTMFGLGHVYSTEVLPWGAVFGNRDLLTMLVATVIACSVFPTSWLRFSRLMHGASSETMVIEGGGEMILQFAIMLLFLIFSVMALSSSDYSPFLYFRF
jgi:alginate O-acetyltransferase complex protein AlgI